MANDAAPRLLLAVCIALFWVQTGLYDVAQVAAYPQIADFASYYFAAHVAAEGGNPYDFRAADALARSIDYRWGITPYFYPPLFVQLIRPLTLLEPATARLLWLALATVALALSWRLLRIALVRQLPGEAPAEAGTDSIVAASWLAGGVALIFATWWPLHDSLWMGQANELVLLCIAAWIWARGRQEGLLAGSRAGVFLGLAMAVKMSPTLLVIFLLSRRAWREAAVAVASAAVLVVVPALLMGDPGSYFFQQVLGGFLPGRPYHGLALPLNVTGNNSLGALAFQLGGEPRSMGLRLTRFGVGIHVVLAASFVCAWSWRSVRSLSWEASLAAGLVLMVILPTYTYEHHLAYLVPAFGLCLRLHARGALSLRAVAALAVCYAVLAQPVARAETLVAWWTSPWLDALGRMWKLPFMIATALILLFARTTRDLRAPHIAPVASPDP